MKNRLLCSMFCVLLFCTAASAAFENHVYRTFYVPYAPGAEKVYGAYRIITCTVDCNTDIVRGNFSHSGNSKQISDVFQTLDAVRSDLVILTKNGIKATGEKRQGNTIYHDTVYYETPEYVIGYFFDFSPVTGSFAVQSRGRPFFVASKVSDLVKLFSGISELELLKALVNYQGINPQGKIIPIGPETYVVSQKPDKLLLNWWQELSQEFLAENMADIKSFGWQEVSGYYNETAFKNGSFASLPLRNIGFKDIPSSDEMHALWQSKKGVLGKSRLPEHFTDCMSPLSPGTWTSPGRTFVSYDPKMLLRWLYNIPSRQGNLPMKVSARISTDFSPLKADSELYGKVSLCDPNISFGFSPFDGKAFGAKGIGIFFPLMEKYRDSRNVSQSFGETSKSIASLPEEMRKAAKEAGSGKFVGTSETHLYGAAGCHFLPSDRNSAIEALNSAGFGNVLKSLGISAGGRP